MRAVLWILIKCTFHCIQTINIPPEQKKIIEDMSWPLKIYFYNDILDSTTVNQSRRVGVQSRVLSLRLQNLETSEDNLNENDAMKIKLFRLMYEAVRDNELKTKRAELIKTRYKSENVFEIGYLTGSIQDKYNIMLDIAATLKKLYYKWKAIDHINAYEQISNQAIEISNLIEQLRSTKALQKVNQKNIYSTTPSRVYYSFSEITTNSNNYNITLPVHF